MSSVSPKNFPVFEKTSSRHTRPSSLKNTSNIHQSNRFHLLEVTDSGTKFDQFSWSEWALMVLGVVILLKLSHLAHYCFFTKKIVRRKLAKLEASLKNQPNVSAPADVVVVPPVEMAHVVPPLVMATSGAVPLR